MKVFSQIFLPLFVTFFVSFSSYSAEVRNITEWNLTEQNLAILGFDPVAYFPEGGGGPTPGDEAIELNHKGVTYRFATEDNMNLFISNPSKYEPAHGGWCATAMAMGQKLVIIPYSYVVKGNRLFLFSFLNNEDARAMWVADPDNLERRADFNWKKMSGEGPRGLEDEY